MELQQLLSKYMLEISKVKTEESLYLAVGEVLKKVLEYRTLNIIHDGVVVYSEPAGALIDKGEFVDFLDWLAERLSPAFIPSERGYVGLVPIFKGSQLLATVVLETLDEPTSETMDYLQLLAYLSGLTLENLRLLDFVDRAREYFEGIINLVNDGIVVFSEGAIEFRNSKAATMLSERPELTAVLSEYAALSEESSFEVELGQLFLNIFVKPVNLLGSQKLLVGIRNITSEKEVQKLRELDKIKTNFIANISHELRTPLAAIKAYTETILNVDMTMDEAREFLSTVYDQSLRLESLLNDLLDFSQLESHTMKLAKRVESICKIVNSAVDALTPLAEQRGVEVRVDCEDFELLCDAQRLEQVVQNILSNAIKFSDRAKPRRFAHVKVFRRGEDAVMIFEDNGIGIPKDKFDKIFEKFYRIDNELTYSISGTGLGLAIVKEIVELHGGTVTVDSTLGEGSTFQIVLPLRPRAENQGTDV